jgi:hypothetical protein
MSSNGRARDRAKWCSEQKGSWLHHERGWPPAGLVRAHLGHKGKGLSETLAVVPFEPVLKGHGFSRAVSRNFTPLNRHLGIRFQSIFVSS